MKKSTSWHQNASNCFIALALLLGFVNFITLIFLLHINEGDLTDLSTISLSITILEFFLVIFALGGFWMVRGAAEKAAREEAVEAVRANLSDLITPDMISKSIMDNPQTLLTIINEIRDEFEVMDSNLSNLEAQELADIMQGDLDE